MCFHKNQVRIKITDVESGGIFFLEGLSIRRIGRTYGWCCAKQTLTNLSLFWIMVVPAKNEPDVGIILDDAQ